jgi:hypothetical protein
MRIAIALLALALASTACKKKETKPAETVGSGSTMVGSDQGSGSAMAGSDMGSGSAMAGSDMGSGSAMAGSGSAMAGSGSGAGTDAMAKKAGMCPSTVLGATTRAEIKGKSVVLIISADEPNATKAVQTRAKALLKEKADKKTGAEHDQKGTHGGAQGICPVYVPEGATATYKVLDAKLGDGAMITITPKDKPDDLKKEIDARITKAADWVKANIKPGDKGNQGGVGGLKNNEGGNHAGQGDGKGIERKKAGSGSGGGAGTGGGGGKGTGGGSGAGSGSAKK